MTGAEREQRARLLDIAADRLEWAARDQESSGQWDLSSLDRQAAYEYGAKALREMVRTILFEYAPEPDR